MKTHLYHRLRDLHNAMFLFHNSFCDKYSEICLLTCLSIGKHTKSSPLPARIIKETAKQIWTAAAVAVVVQFRIYHRSPRHNHLCHRHDRRRYYRRHRRHYCRCRSGGDATTAFTRALFTIATTDATATATGVTATTSAAITAATAAIVDALFPFQNKKKKRKKLRSVRENERRV